jgi:cytochrome P450 PksS
VTSTDTSLDEEFIRIVSQPTADPRPVYARMREAAPAYKTPLGFWYVTRYDLGTEVIRNPKDWPVQPSDPNASAISLKIDSYALQVFRRSLMFMDDPKHRFLRRLVGDLFTPKAVRGMRENIQRIVDLQLDSLDSRGDRDIVELKHEFAEQLPTTVILDMLGIDLAHADRFVGISRAVARILDPQVTPDVIADGDRIWREATAIIDEAISERRAHPRADLMTALIQAGEDGERIAHDDLVGMVMSLGVAGHETTMNMLTNGLYHMLTRPDTFEQLRADRSIMPTAIEEFLRWESPPRNSVGRYPARDIEIGDQIIGKDECVYVGYGACNHDPAEFADPLRFDLTRTPNRHLGLGIGVHHCLGAGLARMEIDIALNTLMDRYPTIEMAGDVHWEPSFVVRALEGLPLRLSRS